MKLTSRERIMRIFRNEEADRPALKLWGATHNPALLHPDYAPVWQLAQEKSDLFVSAWSPFDPFFGQNESRYVEVVDHPLPGQWIDRHCYIHTPKGPLHALYRHSLAGEPGYTLEHAIKEPEDIEKMLSIPYEPFPYDSTLYQRGLEKVGDRGVVMVDLDHAGYAAHRMMGSETLAIMSIDERELLQEFINTLAHRIRQHAQNVLDSGIRAPFSWVGPEVFIPPLMSHNDFTEFVFNVDKPLCDMIHEADCNVWVHCHGRVANFIQDYIDMGVDILNSLEPPKNGDIDLHGIIHQYGRQIGWEGNIEIQTLLQGNEETVRGEIERCADIGKQIGRFVLCPSAGFMEYTHPDENYIRNLLLYLNYGLECLER